jgi:hypothetical protein
VTISHRIFLRMVNVSNKRCRRNESAHFMSSNFFSSENRAVFEIMSKKVVEPERPQLTIWRRVAYWISKATRPQAHSCVCAPTPTHTRTHTHTHTHTHLLTHIRTHAHTDKYVSYLCFLTPTVVSRTRLIVTLYVRGLSCFLLAN